jgi:hypothetical protein
VTTEVVNTVVARCLLEPGYLERFEADPGAEVARLDVDAPLRHDLSALDCGRVRRFAGFISKVQHNDLWDSFPYTRALLKHYGAELDTFATYRREHLILGLAGRPSTDTKTRSFLSFLERRLEAAPAYRFRGLLDVLRHERLLWEVALELSELAGRTPSADQEPAPVTSPSGWIVAPFDVLRVAALSYHPLEVISALEAGSDQLAHVRPSSVCLCYWGRVDGESVSVLEVDALTATVLAAADGRRTARDVIRHTQEALEGEVRAAEVQPVLGAAVDRGLLRLVEASP